MASGSPSGSRRPLIGGIVQSMVLNAVIPLLLYSVAKQSFDASEFAAPGGPTA